MNKRYLFLIIVILFSGQAYSNESSDLDGRDLAKNLYSLILESDTQRILSAFSDTPNIDTPRTGAIKGKQDFIKFIASEKAWLLQYGFVEGSLHAVRTTESADRIVYEQKLTLNNTGPMKHHKIAVVVDLDDGKASTVRVYYRLNPITGSHDFSRPALLEHKPELVSDLAPPIKQYVASIENAYLDVYRMFTEGSCVNHLCGDNLPKFFVMAMHAGSVPLELTTVMCDESACAMEWNLASWGDTMFSIKIGGLSIFEFNNKGQVTEGRIYDDIHDAPFMRPGWFAEHQEALTAKFEAVGCPLIIDAKLKDPMPKAFGKLLKQPCGEL